MQRAALNQEQVQYYFQLAQQQNQQQTAAVQQQQPIQVQSKASSLVYSGRAQFLPECICERLVCDVCLLLAKSDSSLCVGWLCFSGGWTSGVRVDLTAAATDYIADTGNIT